MSNLFPTVWTTLTQIFHGYALGMLGFWQWMNEPIATFLDISFTPLHLFSASGIIVLLAYKFMRSMLF